MWDMCQMLNIWHISHTKPKKQHPIRYGKRGKIIPLMSVPLQICNGTDKCCKPEINILFDFSLSSLFLFDFLSPFSESVSLSLPSSQESQPVLPLLTIGREQEEGNAEEGGCGGQERRKGSRDLVKIGSGSGVGFAERSGFDFWFLISLFSLICWVVGSQLYDDGD